MANTKKELKHLVAIPDGNRRWARAKGLEPWEGHRVGIKALRNLTKAVREAGIEYFTFWGASEDNLRKRSRIEIKFLVSFLKDELEDGLTTGRYVKERAEIRVLGRWNEILKDKKLASLVDAVQKQTAHFTDRVFTILFGYDGKEEMIEAVKKLQRSGESVTRESLKQALWTGDLPPVDLVIRTGGEPHWSAGFMMWLTADSQFYFTKTHWPAFGVRELKKAIALYEGRERRFGK